MHRSSFGSRLLVIAVVVSLGLTTGCSKSQEEKKKEFSKTAARMGQIDQVLSARAIEMVEDQGIVQRVGWQVVDEMMAQASPETRRSYREWREDVAKNGIQRSNAESKAQTN